MSSKEKKDKRKDVVQEEIQEQEKNKVDAPKIFQVRPKRERVLL